MLIRRKSSVCHLLLSFYQVGTLRDKANLIPRKHNQAAAKYHADAHHSNLGLSLPPFLLLHNHGHLACTHYHSVSIQHFVWRLPHLSEMLSEVGNNNTCKHTGIYRGVTHKWTLYAWAVGFNICRHTNLIHSHSQLWKYVHAHQRNYDNM